MCYIQIKINDVDFFSSIMQFFPLVFRAFGLGLPIPPHKRLCYLIVSFPLPAFGKKKKRKVIESCLTSTNGCKLEIIKFD